LVADSTFNFRTATERYSPARMDGLKHAFWECVLAGPNGKVDVQRRMKLRDTAEADSVVEQS